MLVGDGELTVQSCLISIKLWTFMFWISILLIIIMAVTYLLKQQITTKTKELLFAREHRLHTEDCFTFNLE